MNDNLIQFVYLAKNLVEISNSLILLVNHLILILDRVVHYSDSHHIAVYHKGRWFKVFMYYEDNLLTPSELQLYVF